jgi:hypothetical protein
MLYGFRWRLTGKGGILSKLYRLSINQTTPEGERHQLARSFIQVHLASHFGKSFGS